MGTWQIASSDGQMRRAFEGKVFNCSRHCSGRLRGNEPHPVILYKAELLIAHRRLSGNKCSPYGNACCSITTLSVGNCVFLCMPCSHNVRMSEETKACRCVVKRFMLKCSHLNLEAACEDCIQSVSELQPTRFSPTDVAHFSHNRLKKMLIFHTPATIKPQLPSFIGKLVMSSYSKQHPSFF